MMNAWLYSIASVVVVSLISLAGAFMFLLNEKDSKKSLSYLVSFSAGGLFGDTLFHLIPEASEAGFGIDVSFLILAGIVVSFVVERFLQWRHCHIPTSDEHPHSFAYMNLFGDAVHNFIDGLIIGGSYLTSMPLGVTTTLAIVLHEIPQEIGDFGVLVYGGLDKSKALLYNFLTAIIAVFGTAAALGLSFLLQELTPSLIPFAAGSFIYVAGSDLIPELRKEEPALLKSALQLMVFVLGVLILFSMVFLA